MRTTGPRGIRTHIMFLAALAALALMPVASAQLGGSVRIGDTATDLDVNVTGDALDAGLDVAGAGNGTTKLDPTAQAAADHLKQAASVGATNSHLRLHTRVDEGLITTLVASALEVPEVRDLMGSHASLDVEVDKQHFQVDVAGGKVQSITTTDRPADADYSVRAGADAARSLANAADPGFTAIKLLQNRYVTIEAPKLTQQAALKAVSSGALDGRIDVQDGLEDVRFESELTAAEQAILASGLRIVRFDGRLFAANELGGLVAALPEGNRALGSPPAELDVRFSGIAGGTTMDHDRLVALVREGAGADASAPELDEERRTLLQQRGAPDAFLNGLSVQTHTAWQLERGS